MNFKNLLAIAFLALAPIEVAAESGYYNSCNSVQIYRGEDNNYSIFANCRQTSGLYSVGEAIHLNNCFTNSWGHLLPQVRGMFSPSCRNMKLNGSMMYGQCNNGNGGWQDTHIDTNVFIGNINGELWCHGKLNGWRK
ncbi:hypothetical protein ST47_g4559 [Ascochyta rabiei]|uniref:Uncharacterized protein n=1 Tax=Didymella rabiei TaxID=5454 RepID=A0A163FEF2_DIDRA|nr:hypothetical protein ST47_g4559 [Ascochyta rabiei]